MDGGGGESFMRRSSGRPVERPAVDHPRQGVRRHPFGAWQPPDLPGMGDFRLDLTVSERPVGPLPGVSAGGSPAYPLAGRSVLVTRVRVVR